MEKISSLIKTLNKFSATYDHLAGVQFSSGTTFAWNHGDRTISYNPHDPELVSYLLHELGHAILNHQGYNRDIDLIKMERDAWQQAQMIGTILNISVNEEILEEALDSYRDWLHDRSLCPSCSHTGIQIHTHKYRCIACGEAWRVNEARDCALRRYTTKKHS